MKNQNVVKYNRKGDQKFLGPLLLKMEDKKITKNKVMVKPKNISPGRRIAEAKA